MLLPWITVGQRRLRRRAELGRVRVNRFDRAPARVIHGLTVRSFYRFCQDELHDVHLGRGPSQKDARAVDGAIALDTSDCVTRPFADCEGVELHYESNRLVRSMAAAG